MCIQGRPGSLTPFVTRLVFHPFALPLTLALRPCPVSSPCPGSPCSTVLSCRFPGSVCSSSTCWQTLAPVQTFTGVFCALAPETPLCTPLTLCPWVCLTEMSSAQRASLAPGMLRPPEAQAGRCTLCEASRCDTQFLRSTGRKALAGLSVL